MDMTVKDVRKVAEDQVAYYLGSDEHIKIAAMPEEVRMLYFWAWAVFCSI